MKNIYLFFLLIGAYSFGQTVGNGDGITTDTQVGVVFKEIPIEGTQYVDKLYKKGETIIDGKTQTKALMRYDALNESVEILDENQRPRKLLRRKNIVAIIEGKTYEVVDFKNGPKTRSGYLNPLNPGGVILYFRPQKVFVQAEKPENGYDTFDPPTYRDVSGYYLKKGDSPAEPIKLNRRSILKSLGGKTADLKKFVQDHSLNLTKEKDVVRLLNYYNSFHKTAEQNKTPGIYGIGA